MTLVMLAVVEGRRDGAEAGYWDEAARGMESALVQWRRYCRLVKVADYLQARLERQAMRDQ